MHEKNVSVIIPVYNSEQYLLSLFKCLDKQDFSKKDEVLFVDNGSTDSSAILLKEYCLKNNICKYFMFKDKSDSYAARNYGVKNAMNDIFVFTDSDCLPNTNWISEIKKEILYGNIIAGNINIFVNNKKNIWEIFDSTAHMNNEYTQNKGNIATANMAVYRKDFEDVGNFIERYSGGDYEWSRRSIKKGKKIKFAKDALVNHPPRSTKRQIINKEARIAYGIGKDKRINESNYIYNLFLYFLRFFYIVTPLKYCIIFIKSKIKIKDIVEFFFTFFFIRVTHIKYFTFGYKGIDPRKLKI